MPKHTLKLCLYLCPDPYPCLVVPGRRHPLAIYPCLGDPYLCHGAQGGLDPYQGALDLGEPYVQGPFLEMPCLAGVEGHAIAGMDAGPYLTVHMDS